MGTDFRDKKETRNSSVSPQQALEVTWSRVSERGTGVS